MRKISQSQVITTITSLTNSSLSCFELTLETFKRDYKGINQLFETREESYEALEKYYKVQDETEEKLNKAHEEMSKAQKEFAKRNNMILRESENPMAEQFKTIGELND